jgi:hypothetical protein
MSAEIPPPGAERDAEIARFLGDDIEERAEHADVHVVEDDDNPHAGWICSRCLATACTMRGESLPPTCKPRGRPYSTDPAAADRLVEAMRQRFWCLSIQVNDAGDTSGLVAYGANFYKRRSFARDAPDPGGGVTMSDAVSAAALLALRGGR